MSQNNTCDLHDQYQYKKDTAGIEAQEPIDPNGPGRCIKKEGTN